MFTHISIQLCLWCVPKGPQSSAETRCVGSRGFKEDRKTFQAASFQLYFIIIYLDGAAIKFTIKVGNGTVALLSDLLI